MSDERADDEVEEDPKLKSMRAVWLQMRDEEPPQSGLAELLAAARTKAGEMARPSWWKRAMALLRRPPVFALATVMIVLGGALLIGRRVEPQEPAPRIEAKSGDESTIGRATSTANVPGPPPALAPPVEAPPRQRDIPRPAVQASPPPPPPPQAARNENRTDLSEQFGADAVEGGAPAPTKPSADVAPGLVNGEAATGVKTGVKSSAAEAPHDDRSNGVDQLERQCETAAQRGDCAAVRTMVPRIEKTDRTYRKRMTKDSPVAKCLE